MFFFRKRPWATGFVEEVRETLDLMAGEGSVLVDCGAGEGRHSIMAARSGIGRVIAVERDPAQTRIIRSSHNHLLIMFF